MAALIFFNGLATTCTSPITSTQTSIVGQSTTTWSPSGDYIVRIDGTAPGTSTAIFEFVRVTANTQGTGTIVCTRGQGSTVGQAFAAGATLTPVADATAVNAAFVRLDSTSTQAMAAPITVPPGGGLSVPTTGFGSYPVKIDDILVGTDSRYPSASGQITFLNTSNSGTNLLPTGYRHLLIEWYARADNAATSTTIVIRFNNDVGATYDYQFLRGSGTAAAVVSEAFAQNQGTLGSVPAATATANYFGTGEAKVKYYQSGLGNKLVLSSSHYFTANTAGTGFTEQWSSKWRTTGTPITRVDLYASSGNFINGSQFTLYGIP